MLRHRRLRAPHTTGRTPTVCCRANGQTILVEKGRNTTLRERPPVNHDQISIGGSKVDIGSVRLEEKLSIGTFHCSLFPTRAGHAVAAARALVKCSTARGTDLRWELTHGQGRCLGGGHERARSGDHTHSIKLKSSSVRVARGRSLLSTC